MSIVVAIFAAAMLQQRAHPQSQPLRSQKWTAAKYRGLVVGKSKKSEVLKTLGKPQFVGKEQDTGLPIMAFEVSDPVAGTMTVYIRHGLLSGMSLSPKAKLTRADAIKVLGSDYLIVRYATDSCLGEGGASPIYENRDGPIEHMEYRQRGIAVYVRDGEVENLLYVSQPFGPTRSRCRKK